MHNEQFKDPDIFTSPRLSQECTCPVGATVQYSGSVCSPSMGWVIYHFGWFHHCTPFFAILLRSSVLCLNWSSDCICSGSGIAARCYYCSRGKSSLWLICFPVSLSKMLFVVVLVSGGTQGNSSHVLGVGKQILVQDPSAAPSARVAAAPSHWDSCCHSSCSQIFMHMQPTAFSSCQTPFQLSSADVLRARASKIYSPAFPPRAPQLSADHSVAS